MKNYDIEGKNTIKSNVIKTVDSNGWTKLVYNDGKVEYFKKSSSSVTQPGNSWTRYDWSYPPEGYTGFGDFVVTSSFFCEDSAITCNVGCNDTKIRYTLQNKYSSSVTATLYIQVKLLLIP